MGLIQAGFLAAMAALAIPVFVHLLSRWQVRRLEFGTMRFLQEVIQASAHRRRLRRWLLLSTRLLLVALLAVLFARPFIPDRALGVGDRVCIVLVDRSASMNMPGRNGRLLDDAISAGVEAAQRAGADTQIEWAWFDRHVEPLPEGTSHPQAPRATSGETDYLAALSWARDRLTSRARSEAEVVLITDLQQSGLSSEILGSELSFPRDVPVRIIDVGRTAANNLAIINVAAGASQLPPNRPVKVIATLFNFGVLPAEEVPITASASSGKRSVRLKKTLNIPNEQAEEIEFDFGRLEFGTWQVTVDIDLDDDLSSDNRRLTAVEVVAPLKVLVIDPGSSETPSAAISYFLVAALEQGSEIAATERAADAEAETKDAVDSAHFHRFAAEVLYLEDRSISLASAKHSLIIVSDAGTLPPRMIQQLEDYVRSGGKLLVFAGSQLSEAVAQQWSDTQLVPGKLSRAESAAAMPFRIVSISTHGMMLEPFRDPQHGDLGRLAFSSLQKTDILPSTHVLAWFDRQRPALTEHALGSGRVAWFLSSVDNSASNWTTSPLYLPLIQQMASDLLGLTGEGPLRFRSVGDAESELVAPVSPGNFNRSKSKTDNTGPSIYFDQPGFESRPEALYIVNASAKESDPARTDVDSFVEQFDLTLADEDGRSPGESVESQQRHELWPWLAAALVLLLVFEFSLSNRTPA